MKIDTDKLHNLTNFNNVNKGGKAIDADHLASTMKVKLTANPVKPEKTEIYNARDEEGIKTFTNEQGNKFTKYFETNETVLNQVKNWRQTLENHCDLSLKKI